MVNDFEKRLKKLNLDEQTADKVRKLVQEVMLEFPCMSCASKEECSNFKWFVKWFAAS
jgi:hypothetical protein